MSIFSKLFGQKKSETAKETVNDPPVFDNPTEQEINFDKLPDEQNQKRRGKVSHMIVSLKIFLRQSALSSKHKARIILLLGDS